mmetsp:Transcript_5367/g.8479  ORF Transcript_5367/g.8479 Transcript_5367/m.8479 type:complete len:129 (+) Transcript_5367:3-389(+)
MIRSGKYDNDLICKLDVSFPLIVGVVGCLNTDLGKKCLGFRKRDPVTEALTGWFFWGLGQWGVMVAALLMGNDITSAVGWSAAFSTVFVVDYCFIRKQNAALRLPLAPQIANTVLFGIVAYTLLSARY